MIQALLSSFRFARKLKKRAVAVVASGGGHAQFIA
jgi:hypothetical protein